MRMRDKMEAQLRDAERSEQALLAKFNESKRRVVELSEEAASLRATLAQKQITLDENAATLGRLQMERDRVTEVVRAEFADHIALLERDLEAARRDHALAKASHRDELARIQAAKDAELDELHTRVRQTVTKKDETIAALREQLQAASTRADHLEQVRKIKLNDFVGCEKRWNWKMY